MSSIERTPTSVPFGAITGSRRILASLIVCNAIWISSSGAQEYSFPDMTSPTFTSPARQFRVPRAIQMSRSVITPMTFPSADWTGRNGFVKHNSL
jgi:hypothetical protein